MKFCFAPKPECSGHVLRAAALCRNFSQKRIADICGLPRLPTEKAMAGAKLCEPVFAQPPNANPRKR
jgi:hypothetical protein